MTALHYFLTIYPVSLVLICASIGFIVSYFITIISYRVPLMLRQHSGLSLQQRAHCPQCQHALALKDQIPLLSYYLLRGRCRHCQACIGQHYPLIELTTVLLSAGLAWRFGLSWALVGALCLSWGLLTLLVIDFTHFLLPDNITLPLLWLGLLFNIFGTFVPLTDAVLGAMAGYLFLWLIFHTFRWLTQKEGMGYGDFKLFAVAGAWLGYLNLPLITVLASAMAIIFHLKKGRNHYFAFGPYLSIATLGVLCWQ
jgi:prepilin signal peptidase PulO-like enzyme (type II secretory pathway)